MRTILFVCTGNTCRSPMAEAVARHWVAGGGLGPESANGRGQVLLASAGVFADEGSPPAIEAIDALHSVGIEHAGRSKPLSIDMIDKADAILCMTQAHVQAVHEIAAQRPEIDTLIEPLDPTQDIQDPIGRGPEAYQAVLEQLQDIIPRRLKEILSHEGGTRVGSSR